MKQIVESYSNQLLKNDSASLANRCEFMVYPIAPSLIDYVKNFLIPGKTIVMFSGSWRLHLNATYIELKMFKNSFLKFHKSTLFIDYNKSKLFDYVLSKLKASNILILHNDWWTSHLPLEHLVLQLDKFLKYVKPQKGQIICTLPLIHANFNKLTMTVNDAAMSVNGTVFKDSLVIIRK